MRSVPVHADEKARLSALYSYHILDTIEEKDFDDLTTLAAAICQVPIALISLVDDTRQWFKSHKGLSISETPVEHSFCAHAIVSTDEITIIEDAHTDERFKANPFVAGVPNITFYAGVPLINEDGYPLGTLCVIDPDKKTLTGEQKEALKIVARQVMDKLELRRKILVTQAANEALRRSERTVHALNTELKMSEAKMKMLIEQAPVSIIVFRGENFFIEAVNQAMLQLLDKQMDILNKPLLEAIPELKGQPAFNQLYQVFKTGEPVYGFDTPVVLHRDGRQTTGYFNYTFTPLVEEGIITGVIDVAVEVTSQVLARKELENAQDKMNMALDSAQLGVWSVDVATNALTLSARALAIHGLGADVCITLLEALKMVADEHQEKLAAGIQEAILNRKPFELEYLVMPKDNGAQRWLRSNGKAYYDEQGAPLYVTGTMLDITEQKQDEQRKNDFISMVSHELKTPLTSMSGYIQVLLYKSKKGEDHFAINTLEKANRQVGKMTSMINGFLNMSRLESGKIHIDKQSFDMADLMIEMEEETASTITSHPVLFTPAKPAFVCADRDKIGHVISNLISNAAKYSPSGSSIQVTCVTVDGFARVSVQDKGIGISQQNIPKLFERYYRVENNQTKSIAGFGIGLYLCAEIVQRHKGNIWVESEPGHGTIFYFSLPVGSC